MGLRNATRRLRPGSVLTLALAALVAAATADEPVKKKVHTLEGVVVSKADGKPVGGATVAMAHARKGSIHISDGGSISVYGPEEKFLLFLSKRNGKTACETRTDEQGRFTLKNFTSLSAKYSIVAGSEQAGLAILENVRPKDYADTPLRIEIDEPAYLAFPKFPLPADETLSASVYVQLEPQASKASEDGWDGSAGPGPKVRIAQSRRARSLGAPSGPRVPATFGKRFTHSRFAVSSFLTTRLSPAR